jgi:ketosteroid isomerase-like protein
VINVTHRDPQVQYLLDRLALQDLATRYARAIDRRDRALLLSLYHEDAVDNHGVMFTGGPIVFADWQPVVMAQFEVTAHHLTTMNFQLDRDSADGELYFIAYHRTLPPDSKEVIVTGRYLDRYERRQGTWKIAKRQLVWDSFASAAPSPAMLEQLYQLGIAGRGAEDISYQVLPALSKSMKESDL